MPVAYILLKITNYSVSLPSTMLSNSLDYDCFAQNVKWPKHNVKKTKYILRTLVKLGEIPVLCNQIDRLAQ